MEKNTMFSVIMPVYNVERYLREAVDSVLQQTYPDFELILVDDCSPDGCPAICDEYAATDDRVRVIHNPQNQGLGFSRNNGVRQAVGQYVLYMDSDDSMAPDCLDVLRREVDGYDITVFGVTRFYEDKDGGTYKTERLSPAATVTDSLRQSGQLLIELNKAKVFPFAWNKAYNREFLLRCNHLFEKTKLIEDFLYNIELFQRTDKIKVLEQCFYNYRKPAHQTLVNTYSPDFFSLVKRKFGLECEFLKNTGSDTNENLQYVYFMYVKHLISVFIRNGSVSAKLSAKQQKTLIKTCLTDPITKSVVLQYRPQGIPLKLLNAILKRECVSLCYYISKLVKR